MPDSPFVTDHPELETDTCDPVPQTLPEETEPAGTELEAHNAELEAHLATAKDQLLRSIADHENAKKRSGRETGEAITAAVQGLLGDFLPVNDNLGRALASADPDDQLAKGVGMVRDLFDAALAKHDIVAFDSVGSAFDPALHEAIEQVDSDEHETGVIVGELERGYMRAGKLFRVARVSVAR